MLMKQRLLRLAVLVALTLLFVSLFTSQPATATHSLDACSPLPTPEPMDVDPVTSPTKLFTQTLHVRLGNGIIIVASSEAGTAAVTGYFTSTTSVPLTITLRPQVTHHIVVTGVVEWAPTCLYILTRTTDKYGAPLTIVQQSDQTFLPVVLAGQKPRRIFLPLLWRS